MDIKQLRQHLDLLAATLKGEDKKLLEARLEGLISAYPFNEYEYMLAFLLDRKIISFAEYEKLRANYISSNKYLDLYGLSPRVFGEIWGHDHIKDLDKRFINPTKSLDPNYDGQYDLLINGVRVEVKSARAINTKKRGSLASKALHYGSPESFWMNFQQIKLDICDVFIFVGVWCDLIVYWILSNDEIKRNRYLSHQHRGGIEYQIGITHRNIADFDEYKVSAQEVANRVIEKGKSQYDS